MSSPDDTIIRGPALVYGSAISRTADRAVFSQGDITITRRSTTFDVGTSHIPTLDTRLDTLVHEITFTPSGRVAEVLDVLTPAWDLYPGEKVLKQDSVSVSGVVTNSAGAKIAVTLSAATVVFAGQYVTLTGMSVSGYNGTWKVHSVSSSTVIVLNVAYSADATGTCKVPRCLIIHPIRQDGEGTKPVLFQYAGPTAYPDLRCSGKDTMLGAVTFSAVAHPYLDPADTSDAIVNYLTWAAPSSTLLSLIDAADIPTIPPRVRYAEEDVNAFTGSDSAAVPWKEFRTLDGVSIATALSTQPDSTDMKGLVNWTVTNVAVTATLTPVGEDISEQNVLALLNQQGAAVGRGRSLAVDVRELSLLMEDASDSYVVAIPSAVPQTSAAAYGAAPRNGALTFSAIRTVSSGAQQPLASFTVS